MLERVLHSADSVFSVGELHCLWRMPHADINCACGQKFVHEKFWREVMRSAAFDQQVIEELRSMEAKVCRTGFVARHRFNLASMLQDSQMRRFNDIQMRLFDAISDVSGRSVVVDSSKAGPRAWILAGLEKVKIVHLYRDPGDVIASWRSGKFDPGLGQNMKRMSVLDASIDWAKVEQLSRLLGRQTAVERVNYRVLCETPKLAVERMIERLGLRSIIKVNWLTDSSVAQGLDYHSLNGNPDRFDKGPIIISARSASQKKFSVGERVRVNAAAQGLRFLYPQPRV